MDENIINLIRNRISNDYCKLMCDEIIEEKSKVIMESYIIGLMIYCMIYDIPYFVEYIYKENTQNNILKEQEQINILYLYYLEKNNKEDINLKNKILEKYTKGKIEKRRVTKEIQKLRLINFDRKIIKYNNKKQENIVIKKFLESQNRLNIIACCIKYKFLINNLNLKDNKKIDRILNWNIFLIKKYNSIEDKIWLI